MNRGIKKGRHTPAQDSLLRAAEEGLAEGERRQDSIPAGGLTSEGWAEAPEVVCLPPHFWTAIPDHSHACPIHAAPLEEKPRRTGETDAVAASEGKHVSEYLTVFVEPLTRKLLTLEEVRRALTGDE